MPNAVGGISVANNTLANTALYNLNKNQNALGGLVKQLSSGLRINSAADDPSGLGIATNLESQVQGFDTAARNVQNVSNAANVVDGALASVTTILQRVRSLAIEASSDLTSANDKNNLQSEISQLLVEVNTISQNTTFNGISLLDGTHAGAQPAVNAGFTITANSSVGAAQSSGSPVTAPTLTATSSTQSETITGLVANATYTIASTITFVATWQFRANGVLIGSGSGFGATPVSGTVQANGAGDIVLQVTAAGGPATANSPTTTPVGSSSSGTVNLIQSVSIGTTLNTIVDGTLELQVAQLNATQQALVVNFFTSSTSVGAQVSLITLTAAGAFTFDGVTVTYANAVTVDVGITSFLKISQFVTQASNPTAPAFNFQEGANEGAALQVGLANTNTSTLRITNVNVATTGGFAFLGAEDAIGQVDNALNAINSQRALLGAAITRLQVDADNDNTASVNLQASESAIRDLNVGSATADYNRTQILVQIGTTVLAQSNTNAQTVLGLFR